MPGTFASEARHSSSVAFITSRFVPKIFSTVHPKFRTPWRSNLLLMVFVSLFSGFLPISSLGNMTSIGTLLAFVIVCTGIMVMRRTQPDLPRPYKAWFYPWTTLCVLLASAAFLIGSVIGDLRHSLFTVILILLSYVAAVVITRRRV